MKAAQGAMSGHVIVPPEPDHPFLLVVLQLVQFVFNYFSAALMLLCVAADHAVGRGAGRKPEARLPRLAGQPRREPAGLVVFIIGLLAAALVVGLVSAVVGGIAALVHPALGGAIVLLVWGAFGVAVLVVLVAASYYAWRDMFEVPGAARGPAPAVTQIEA